MTGSCVECLSVLKSFHRISTISRSSLCQTPFMCDTVSWPLDDGESWDMMGLMPPCPVILCPSFLGLCESQPLREIDVWRAPKPWGSQSPNTSMWHAVFWCEKLYIGDDCVVICQTLSFSAQRSQSPVYSHPIIDAGHKHIHSHKHSYLQAEMQSLRGLYGRYCVGIPLCGLDNIVSILQMRKRAQRD